MSLLRSGKPADPLTEHVTGELVKTGLIMAVSVIVWLALANILFTKVFYSPLRSGGVDPSLAAAGASVRDVLSFADSGAPVVESPGDQVRFPDAIVVGSAGHGNAFSGTAVPAKRQPVKEQKIAEIIRERQTPAPAPAPVPAPIGLRLKGIVRTGGRELAIIQSPAGSRTVATGEAIGDWTVDAIDGNRVILSKEAETRTIVMEASK